MAISTNNITREAAEHPILRNLSKQELIHQIEDLQEELRMSRAFSNIGESGANDAILQWRGRNRFLAEKVIPVRLKPIASESLHPERGEHRIIDGDNLAVMTSLLTDFRGGTTRGFDVIYMDPPYNTGEDVFSYNDDYSLSKTEVKTLRRAVGRSESLVSLDDPTRHTKWINHMAPRLWAAKKLLKSTGVIIVSIDEHELPRLWMLMEEIFSEKNRIATLVWERSRKNDAGYVSEGHEYMLVWARNKAELDSKRSQMAKLPAWQQVGGRWRKQKDGVDEILMAYAEAKQLHGNDVPKIQKAMDAFFDGLPPGHPAKKIRYKKVNQNGMYNDDGNPNWPGGGGPRYDLIHPVTGKPCKMPKLGWIYQEAEMKRLVEQGRVAFKKDHTGIPRLITYLHEMDTEVQTSVILRSGQRSVEVIEAILGKGIFKNPKDHEILAELFNLVTWRDKNAVILDPYAGSGTTGHAVLAMNSEDGGNRFGDSIRDLDRIILDHIPLFAPKALQADGAVTTRVFDMSRQQENVDLRTEVKRDANDTITPWEFLSMHLGAIDSRIINDNGTIFSANLKDDEKLRQPMQFGSDAMVTLANTIPQIKERLNEKFLLKSLGRHGVHAIKPFKLVSPDIDGGTEAYREKYKVRRFKNSLHAEYNGFNPFELKVAQALDVLGKPWCRNPVGKDGYKIPIQELGSDTVWFYPDFLLWAKQSEVWAIDPKGKHLLETAVTHKLLDLGSLKKISPTIRVAFVLEGSYTIDQQGVFSKTGKEGFTLVHKPGTKPKAVPYTSLKALIKQLI